MSVGGFVIAVGLNLDDLRNIVNNTIPEEQGSTIFTKVIKVQFYLIIAVLVLASFIHFWFWQQYKNIGIFIIQSLLIIVSFQLIRFFSNFITRNVELNESGKFILIAIGLIIVFIGWWFYFKLIRKQYLDFLTTKNTESNVL